MSRVASPTGDDAVGTAGSPTSAAESSPPDGYLDADGYLDGSYDGPAPIHGKLLRLLLWLAPSMLPIFVMWGAVGGVLLALQVAALDEAHKQPNLAVVATLGSIGAIVAQPVAGMVADRTRSRFGRRAPWIVGGALVGGLALICLGAAHTLVTVALSWVAVQVAYNVAQGPMSAVLPDRVPRAVRGTFAAGIGMATMAGMVGGQAYGAAFADAIPAGYLVLAGLVLVVVTLFVVVNPDRPSTDLPREPWRPATLLRTFWVSPRQHPDFAWAFAGRFGLSLGFSMIGVYQLYALQDYIGLGAAAVRYVPLLAAVQLVGIVATTAIGGPLSDRLGRRKVFVVTASVVLGGSLFIPVLSPTLPAVFAMAGVAGLGYGCFQAVDTALVSEVLPSQTQYGKDLGVINIAATGPQAVAPAVAGLVFAAGGGTYPPVFVVAGLLALASAFLVLPIRSVR